MAADTMDLALASFRGPDTSVCFRAAAAELGDDAVVLRTVLHGDAVPAERAEAKNLIDSSGKSRSTRMRRIASPT